MSRVALLGFAALSKIGSDFSKKGGLKLKLPKNHFNKKCAPKLLLFNVLIDKRILNSAAQYTLPVSRSEYSRDKPFLLTTVSYFKN